MTEQPVAPEQIDDPFATTSGGGLGKGAKIGIAIAAVVVVAIAAAATYLLLSSGDEQLAVASRPPKGTPYKDGLVLKATTKQFDLMTKDEGLLKLYVKPADKDLIDVQHAQSHASLGQPIRLFYSDQDGKKYIIFLEDAPLQ
jgi:hypothetical protein